MKKIFLLLGICGLIAITACFAVGCKPNEVTSKTLEEYQNQSILFLGDSIAEGVAGPAPIEERDAYAYFSILGQINGYTYNNRAVSGHQTWQMLEYISRGDEDAYVTNTLIRQADIICISISGNDLLFSNFPHMLYEHIAHEEFGEGFVDNPMVQKAYVYNRHGTVKNADGELVAATPGSGIEVFERVLVNVTKTVGQIIAKLREYNPDAYILFQNVYNPVDDESEMIPQDLVEDLIKVNAKYDFSTPSGVAEYRRWGAYLLGRLSDSVASAIDAAQDAKVQHVNVAKVFDDIYNADVQKGKDLIFVDGVHPSDKGHAVIAATLQQRLIDLELAEGVHSLSAYKELRKAQMTARYASAQGFDLAAAKAAVDAATTMQEVSDAYFAATDAYLPAISASPTSAHVNGVAVEAEKVYKLSGVVMGNADATTQQTVDDMLRWVVLPLAKEADLTLKTDGTAAIRLTLPVGRLLRALAEVGYDVQLDNMVIGGLEDKFYVDEQGNMTGLKLSGALDVYRTIKVYANALFPGFDIEGGHAGKHFQMIYRALGIGFEGVEPLFDEEYVDECGLPKDGGGPEEIDSTTIGAVYESYLDYLIAYMSRFSAITDAEGNDLHVDRTPEGLTAMLKTLDDVTIKLDMAYSLVDVTGQDGTVYHAVYCGNYSEKTSPWFVLTQYTGKDKNGNDVEMLSFVLALANIRVQWTLQ